MRLALALTVAVVGCGAAVSTDPPTSASGEKRWVPANVSRVHPVKGLSRRSPLSRPSRHLVRGPIAHVMQVTGYCYTGSRNAAGNWPAVGTAAANDYPLGTRLHVEDYGTVTVEDRSAPGATGVDLYLGSDSGCEARAIAWGRRLLHVTEVR